MLRYNKAAYYFIVSSRLDLIFDVYLVNVSTIWDRWKKKRNFLTVQASKTMIHAFVTSRVDYCNSVVHGASTVHTRPSKNVLNAAANAVMNKRKFEHITADIRDQLHWLPLQQRTEYKTCVIVYKWLHEMAPAYLAEMCTQVSATVERRHLRSSAHGDLVVPRCRTTRYGQRSFLASGPALWNSLPQTVRDPCL